MASPISVARRARCAGNESLVDSCAAHRPLGKAEGAFVCRWASPAIRLTGTDHLYNRRSIASSPPGQTGCGVEAGMRVLGTRGERSSRSIPTSSRWQISAPLGKWTNPPAFEAGDCPFESSTARQPTLRSSADDERQAANLEAVSSNLTGEPNHPAGGAPPATQVLRSTARTAVSNTANVGSNPAGPANRSGLV